MRGLVLLHHSQREELLLLASCQPRDPTVLLRVLHKKVAENDIGEYGLASPGVADGAIYIRTESSLFKIGK